MPRFLNTRTGDFEWHPDPKAVTYAVLSHVWRDPKDGGEQSYQDVLKVQASVVISLRKQKAAVMDKLQCLEHMRPSLIPRPSNLISRQDTGHIASFNVLFHPEISDKIKGLCKVAREAGFSLAWNDACCIDKTSSAELSEAINSMYEWYRLSDMCYVYLSDVPDDNKPHDPWSTFRWSRWHRRGWTLQELIVPERVVFLTNTWRFLGTKIGLATTFSRVTGVDVHILAGRATLDSVSVARRMPWAVQRRTTRVENEAYCLTGIFGIHMSPIYGEGENAFLRLQEEIIRTILDQTIFT